MGSSGFWSNRRMNFDDGTTILPSLIADGLCVACGARVQCERHLWRLFGVYGLHALRIDAGVQRHIRCVRPVPNKERLRFNPRDVQRGDEHLCSVRGER